MAMDDYDIDELPNEEMVYIIAATCGQGELPANMKYFAKEIGERDDIDLSNTKYAVFGLGDTSYIHYNAAAKEIDDRFEELKGQRVIEIGLGNDKDDEKFETAWYDWFPELASEVGIPEPPDVV